jgi:hypothetical protein
LKKIMILPQYGTIPGSAPSVEAHFYAIRPMIRSTIQSPKRWAAKRVRGLGHAQLL